MPERWLPNPAPYPPVPPSQWPAAPPPEPVAESEPPAPERGNGWAVAGVVVGAGIAALLVAVAAVALLRPKHHSAPPFPTSTTSSTTPSTRAVPAVPAMTQAQLDAAVAELVPFVEEKRGLRFTTPPTATLQDVGDFEAAWDHHLDTLYGSYAERLQTPFQAFKMIDGQVDLREAVHTWFGKNAVTFYDHVGKRIQVRANPLTSFVRYELVVDLVTQLDDQHFGLAALTAGPDLGDAQFALRTLLEGDTQRIARLWGGTLPFDEQQNLVQVLQDHQPGQTGDPVPGGLSSWLSDTGLYGPGLWDALRVAGDQARQDDAFRTPPAGSAQAIGPARYLRGDRGTPVEPPAPDGAATVSSEGQFGLLLLRTALQPHVRSDLLSTAMTGYAGDSLVAWSAGGGSCARIRVASTNPAGTDAMYKSFEEWAPDVAGTVALIADPARPGQQLVEATVCSGGASAPDTGPGGPGPGTDTGGGAGV